MLRLQSHFASGNSSITTFLRIPLPLPSKSPTILPMKLGIIGKPQSGKTTIFNAASGQEEAVGDFSQASHRAIIKVPDERIDNIAEIDQPKKIVHAEIEFLDAPGFTGKGKEAGAGEISNDLKLMDAFIMVIDAFSSDSDPDKFIPALVDEMILSDLTIIESNITKKSKKMKVTGNWEGQQEVDLLKQCQEWLENEKPLIDKELTSDEEKMLRGYTFLSQKPLLIVLNISEDKIGETDSIYEKYSHHVSENKRDLAVICGEIEAELITMDEEERNEFMSDLGIKSPAVEQVIQKAYSLIGLISFITSGKPSTQAWTIRKGSNAPKAAGAIHTDFEKGFIRAEVTSYDDYMEFKTPAALKAAGKTRVEGKEYIVQDGDIILFRFNV